jgi:hypothetical protein
MIEPHIVIEGWETPPRRGRRLTRRPLGLLATLALASVVGIVVGAVAVAFHWPWGASFAAGLLAGFLSNLLAGLRITRR